MKKLLLAFGFLALMPAFSPAEAEVVNYWDYWRSYHQGDSVSDRKWSRYISPRYSTRRPTATTRRLSTTHYRPQRTTVTSTPTSRWQQYLQTRYRNTLTNRPLYQNPTYSRPTVNDRNIARNGVWATVTPIEMRESVNEITAAPVNLFRIGLSHNAVRTSDFVPAVYIEDMRFQITDNSGVVSDFSHFELVVDGETFDFDRQGFATVDFNNLRLARSEDRAIDVAVRIEDPSIFPRLPGTFRVKLSDVNAVKEFSNESVDVTLSGRTVSNYVVINPRGSVSAGGSSSANVFSNTTIEGRPLGGSEKAYLMALTLNAAFDDFLLEEMIVRNVHGNNADQLVSQLNLVDLASGNILDSTRFVNGVATFDISNQSQPYIARNTRSRFGIQAIIKSSPNTDNIDNRLTLTLSASDIELFGVGAGREVPDSRKNVSIDSETFTVGQATLTTRGGISFPAEQPVLFMDGSLNQVGRFQITNGGANEVSFARFSLQVTPRGAQFANGGSISDFQLVELVGVRERQRFTTTNVNGNVATFDANDEIYLDAGQTRTFAVLATLENTGDLNDNDGVVVSLVGDGSFQRGTLDAVRASGAQFIWSDHSGRPHVPGSTDWLSGYQFPGLPTNAIANTLR